MHFPDSRLFRRQFVLGPRAFRPTPEWRIREIRAGWVLSTHPDLEVWDAVEGDRRIVLLGACLDPLAPHLDGGEIVRTLVRETHGLNGVLDRLAGMTGRWALLYRGRDAWAVLHDAFGARRVFHHRGHQGLWCGSDPLILAANTRLEPDDAPELAAFLASSEFARMEGAWVGDGTRYRDCRRLLPNHYLDLDSGAVVRFFPSGHEAPSKPVPAGEAVERASPLLEGALAGIARGRPSMLAVTAGWDSRVLLAAARDHVDSLGFFVDRFGLLPEDHPDVTVPLELSRALGFPFEVENSADDPPPEFVESLRRNVDEARMLPKTRAIHARGVRGDVRTSVNGNGGEVARSFFDPWGRIDGDGLDGEGLAAVFGYPGSRFASDALERWRRTLPTTGAYATAVLDLLYWEQRMGNWGVLYAAEQDLAVDEISPFNNRLLLSTLLATAAEDRRPPGYPLHRRLIEGLWPEVLAVPVNPPVRRDPDEMVEDLVRRIRWARGS